MWFVIPQETSHDTRLSYCRIRDMWQRKYRARKTETENNITFTTWWPSQGRNERKREACGTFGELHNLADFCAAVWAVDRPQ